MRRHCGLTLIELMISIVIISLLLCFSMPLYQKHLSDTKTTLLKRELIAILATARLQAFLLGQTLVLEPLLLTSTGVWQQGVQLRMQHGEILHHWLWPESHGQISWVGFYSKEFILIDAYPDKLAMNGYFQIDETRLIINRFGRVRAP